MAYDIHIVRTKDWTEAATTPITKQDVDALIAADLELTWSATDYVDMADDGVTTRYYMIIWRDAPCFWWYRDQIQCSGPDDAKQAKLVQMARSLKAYVVGDDGEIYPLEPKSVPSAQTLAQPNKKPWPLWKQLIAAFLLGCVLLALKLMLFGH